MSTYGDRQKVRIARSDARYSCGSIGQHKRLRRRAERQGAPDLGSRNNPPKPKASPNH